MTSLERKRKPSSETTDELASKTPAENQALGISRRQFEQTYPTLIPVDEQPAPDHREQHREVHPMHPADSERMLPVQTDGTVLLRSIFIASPVCRHPQTLLVTEMMGAPLTQSHGAPLRIHMPTKYGYKQIKRIGLIAYTNDKPDDYWTELGYDWYGGL